MSPTTTREPSIRNLLSQRAPTPEFGTGANESQDSALAGAGLPGEAKIFAMVNRLDKPTLV